MRIFVLVLAFAAPAIACGGDTAGEALARMRTTRDQICACPDTPCVEQARDAFDAWRSAHRDKLGRAKATASFREAYQDAYLEAAACESKVARDAAREALRLAEDAQREVEAAQKAAEAALATGAELSGFLTKLTDLGKQLEDLERDLAAAGNQAERDAVEARRVAIMTQYRQVQADLDRHRAKAKPKCPPHQPPC